MAEEIRMWKSNDGSLHDSKVKAENHDYRIACVAYFDSDPLFGPYEGCTVGGNKFMDYVDEHREMLIKYLNVK